MIPADKKQNGRDSTFYSGKFVLLTSGGNEAINGVGFIVIKRKSAVLGF